MKKYKKIVDSNEIKQKKMQDENKKNLETIIKKHQQQTDDLLKKKEEKLDRLQSQWPDIPVLVLLPHGVPADAWALVRAGASDCLLGTPSDHRLWTALRILSLLSAQENRFDAFDEDDSIELILVQPAAGRPSLADGRPVSASLAELEREAILDALGRTSGNVSEAGRLLGIPRTSLYRKLRRYGLR